MQGAFYLCPFALNNLGVMYLDGRGVGQSNEQARKWFRLAAEQGDVGAKVNLGIMYIYTDEQLIEGMKLVRQARKEGYPFGVTQDGLFPYVKSQRRSRCRSTRFFV